MEIAHHRLLTGKVAEQGLADAPAVATGRRFVEQLACRRCHVVGGTGNRLAASLDLVAWRRDQHELERSIAEPVVNMPRFGLAERQVEAVIAFLLNGADPGLSEATYRVRFTGASPDRDSVFETRCGGCHRALGPAGPRGRGSAGPNLSGLFTPFFPAAAPGGRPWTPDTLEKWLLNPRAVRPLAAMRPVRMEPGEWERLVEELGVAEAEGGSASSRDPD